MAEISGLHRVQSSVEGLSSDRFVPTGNVRPEGWKFLA